MTLSLDKFIPTVRAAIPRFNALPPNPNQESCIKHPCATPLMIAAGPGTGKTTVLVLRALRFVFVDGLLPEHIVITTFTRKAAQELRARLIEWGLALRVHLQANPIVDSPDYHEWLDSIDVNRFVTGTLDSLSEEMLAAHRDPGDSAPVLVEGFVGNALLAREGLFAAKVHSNPEVKQYLAQFTLDRNPPKNFGELIKQSRDLMDRLIYDRVDLEGYSSAKPFASARQSITAALDSYRKFMDSTNRMDFARLEEIFLERLAAGKLKRFVEVVRALLVDEYQDTNPLQEAIYFELIRQTGATFTVVGDDDQSLYRFRGATVELYRDFHARFSARLPKLASPDLKYLVDNYRSTPEIVTFFNEFIRNDPQFQTARVQPLKPLIVAKLQSNSIPVLGMFREDASVLADALTKFLWDVFRGNGRTIDVSGQPVQIVRNANGGDFGDAVVLGHTVNEYGSRWGSNPPRERLPLLVQDRLEALGVSVFNPHGRSLRDIPQVQQLLGLLLDCIDAPDANSPEGRIQTTLASPPSPGVPSIRGEAHLYLRQWRGAGRAFVAHNPHPNQPHSLKEFVEHWQTRTSQTTEPWPDDWPLLELCFKLVAWFPFFQNDPEGQVYLEAIARCVSQAATYSPYGSSIIAKAKNSGHIDNSVRRAILDIFVPLAESEIEVDEDIMPHVPRTRLPFLTIHQAKGLEFPLVIVDVSSDYQTDSPKTRFRRFPENPSSVECVEDDMAPYCEIGSLRTIRSPLARSFDDLVRLYYVAFSRAQSAVLLVGLYSSLRYNTTIRNVATEWRADGSWPWKTPVQGSGKKKNKMPAMANNIPLVLV